MAAGSKIRGTVAIHF